MQSVVIAIQNLDVEVEHVPDWCTGLCETVDFAIDRILKPYVTKLWMEWMVGEVLQTGVTKAPS